MVIRSLICSFLGHVDHGKSSILDKIRSTSIVKGEAGGITQAIGASIIPLDTIKKVCGDLLKALKMDLNIPGLLMIDTPGHAAFTNLRKRGGSLADISVLVIDVNEGMKPQTLEAIEILKAHKTPFIVAANKIDKISGWQKQSEHILDNISKQTEGTRNIIETKMYELVGKFYEMDFEADRFDRVSDYTKQLAIVPVSAITGEGIPELLMVMIGLAQKYLQESLEVNIEGPAKGTILEVKESSGLGITLDVIIFDGKLRKGDEIIIGSLEKPIVTKIRALFEPAPLAEMRDRKSQFIPVDEVQAATGVKISAPGIEDAIAGMPLWVVHGDIEKLKAEIQEQVEEVVISTDETGVILKADTLGGLEALITLFHEHNIPIRKATIGKINKKDIMDALSNKEVDPLTVVVFGFNVEVASDVEAYAKDVGVHMINNPIIYTLIDEYKKWVTEKKKEFAAGEFETLTKPCKLQVMPGYVFRQSNPAVCGVEILEGNARTGVKVMKDGKAISTMKEIQKEKKNVSTAEKGDQVAMSFPDVIIGRQINEGDILYSYIPEEEFKKLKEFKNLLTPEQKELLKEIAEIMRRNYQTWGI